MSNEGQGPGPVPASLDNKTNEELEALCIERGIQLETGSGADGAVLKKDYIAALREFSDAHDPGKVSGGQDRIACKVVAPTWSQEGAQYSFGSRVLVPKHRLDYCQEKYTNPPIVPIKDEE